jgi:hypothetical protein
MSEKKHSGLTFKSRTYFGDGEWDRKAANTLGYRFVLVGSSLEHQPAIDHYSDIPDIIDKIGL